MMTARATHAFLVLSLCAVLAGCVTTGRAPDPSLSTDTNSRAALVGKVAPAVIAGLSITERDVQADAEARALNFAQPGEPVKWVGDSDETTGSITALAPFRVGSSTCRKFVHAVKRGEQQRSGSATACRRGSNAWRLVS